MLVIIFFIFFIFRLTQKTQKHLHLFLYVCLFKVPTTELNDLSFFVTACDQRTYGENCSEICSPNCAGLDQACDNVNGSCISGCDNGYVGEKCDSFGKIDKKDSQRFIALGSVLKTHH